MSDTKKFGRMTPIKPEDIVCIHCNRNATETIFSKVCDGAECQTCKKYMRQGKPLNPNLAPAHTDKHICPGCGNYKSFRRQQCKRCHFGTDKSPEEIESEIMWDKITLGYWLQDRRNRIARKQQQGAK